MFLVNIYNHLVSSVRAINQRFSRPHIIMTPWVKSALLFLRLYLLLLVGLMIYKFITVLKH